MKRKPKPGPTEPERNEDTKPLWPIERHSGEGSASALETLQKLEKRRVATRPADPQKDPPSR